MAGDLKRRIAKIERFLAQQPSRPKGTALKRVQAAWKDASVEDRMKIIGWIQDQLQDDPVLLEGLG